MSSKSVKIFNDFKAQQKRIAVQRLRDQSRAKMIESQKLMTEAMELEAAATILDEES